MLDMGGENDGEFQITSTTSSTSSWVDIAPDLRSPEKSERVTRDLIEMIKQSNLIAQKRFQETFLEEDPPEHEDAKLIAAGNITNFYYIHHSGTQTIYGNNYHDSLKQGDSYLGAINNGAAGGRGNVNEFINNGMVNPCKKILLGNWKPTKY
ncbi:hypothetical protein CPB84DRAFT_830943 [Gymnopilus junonius]|uniref:Uncharacterized protein n=1 Tax=Gymnopilus junonius TaxID=109634 RepID=A0A9P5NSX1_GYMJU|nr:hypothetical protein CPB84DRAFT_830943 [Gymnopilus junonius]